MGYSLTAISQKIIKWTGEPSLIFDTVSTVNKKIIGESENFIILCEVIDFDSTAFKISIYNKNNNFIEKYKVKDFNYNLFFPLINTIVVNYDELNNEIWISDGFRILIFDKTKNLLFLKKHLFTHYYHSNITFLDKNLVLFFTLNEKRKNYNTDNNILQVFDRTNNVFTQAVFNEISNKHLLYFNPPQQLITHDSNYIFQVLHDKPIVYRYSKTLDFLDSINLKLELSNTLMYNYDSLSGEDKTRLFFKSSRIEKIFQKDSLLYILYTLPIGKNKPLHTFLGVFNKNNGDLINKYVISSEEISKRSLCEEYYLFNTFKSTYFEKHSNLLYVEFFNEFYELCSDYNLKTYKHQLDKFEKKQVCIIRKFKTP